MRDNKRATVALIRNINNSTLNATTLALESNGTLEKTKVDDDKEALDDAPSQDNANSMDQESQLLQAVKNAQFFQPDVNALTMRFDSAKEETTFQNFLMNKPEEEHSLSIRQISQIGGAELGLVEKKTIWTDTSNSLFMSLLVSFLVNVCVSTAYFLAFVASSSAEEAYKTGPSYTTHLILMICLFVGFLIVQAAFMALNLANCSRVLTLNNFAVVHVIAVVALTLAPIFIMATCIPIISSMADVVGSFTQTG